MASLKGTDTMEGLAAHGNGASAAQASANDTVKTHGHTPDRLDALTAAWERAVRRWAGRLKLDAWHITTRVSEEESAGEFAVTHINSESFDAVCVLNPHFDGATWPRTLDDIACHEMLHLVMAQLMWPIKDAVGTGLPTPYVPGHDMAHAVGKLWDRAEETLVDYLAYRMTELAARGLEAPRTRAPRGQTTHNGNSGA